MKKVFVIFLVISLMLVGCGVKDPTVVVNNNNGDNNKISDTNNSKVIENSKNNDIVSLQNENNNMKIEIEELKKQIKELSDKVDKLQKEKKSDNEESDNDASDESLPKEQKSIDAKNFTEVCEPYEGNLYGNYIEIEPFKMQGITYANGISVWSANNSTYFSLFNLNGKYSKLEFDIGHVDKSGSNDGIISFYIDDKLCSTITKKALDGLSHEVIELNKGNILKIEYSTKCTVYGLANMYIYE